MGAWARLEDMVAMFCCCACWVWRESCCAVISWEMACIRTDGSNDVGGGGGGAYEPAPGGTGGRDPVFVVV